MIFTPAPDAPCPTGKECYPSKATAPARIRDRQRRYRLSANSNPERRKDLATLTPYRCALCHHWHVGSLHTLRKVHK